MNKTSLTIRIVCTTLICALATLIAIVAFTQDFNYYAPAALDYEYYGGDAYTGIQHATIDTARHIRMLGYLCEDFFCFVAMIIGFSASILSLASITLLIIDICKLTKLCKEENNEKNDVVQKEIEVSQTPPLSN